MKKFNKGRLLYSDLFVKDSDGFYYETGKYLEFRFGKPLFIGRGKGRKMKTSKEMQLKIIDKMRENVESGNEILHRIQYYNEEDSIWVDSPTINKYSFTHCSIRIKPQTITINGVEIPKPLDSVEKSTIYYIVDHSKYLYEAALGVHIKAHGVRFVYKTKEEAIEASKLLFGIKGE